MDDSTRRRFLGISGLAATVGLTGCLRTQSGGGTPTQQGIRDTDGDGVIDSEDYAPRDPEIQREEQVKDDSTATEQQPPTETNTSTDTEIATEESTETPTQSGLIFQSTFENAPIGQSPTDWTHIESKGDLEIFEVQRGGANGTNKKMRMSGGYCNGAPVRTPELSANPNRISFYWKDRENSSNGPVFRLLNEDDERFMIIRLRNGNIQVFKRSHSYDKFILENEYTEGRFHKYEIRDISLADQNFELVVDNNSKGSFSFREDRTANSVKFVEFKAGGCAGSGDSEVDEVKIFNK